MLRALCTQAATAAPGRLCKELDEPPGTINESKGVPLFNAEAWKKANNILLEVLSGHYSDPPGIDFYHQKLDAHGAPATNNLGLALLESWRTRAGATRATTSGPPRPPQPNVVVLKPEEPRIVGGVGISVPLSEAGAGAGAVLDPPPPPCPCRR